MTDPAEIESVLETYQRIEQAWLQGRTEDLRPMTHPSVLMVFPGFSGRSRGRDAFIAGFEEFSKSCTIHDYQAEVPQVDVVERTAVVNVAYEMVYERGGAKYCATGRDLWVFTKQGEDWLAVWRTMLDLTESPLAA